MSSFLRRKISNNSFTDQENNNNNNHTLSIQLRISPAMRERFFFLKRKLRGNSSIQIISFY